MKYRLLILVLIMNLPVQAQLTVKLCTWNIRDIGNSKSDTEISFIANTIKDFDVVAIQEVVAGNGGAQAIARLAAELNVSGLSWDYTISNPTSSSAYKQERYAFLWKKNKVTKIGEAWLEQQYGIEIDREPYFATFLKQGKYFTLVNFHAITKKMQPETEIKYFKFLPAAYPGLNLIFAGDFNCPQSHTVFNPLKQMGYQAALTGQKTSLRQQCIVGDCLASEFDNVFYNSKTVTAVQAGVVHFYTAFASMQEAGKISDHVPVYCTFSLN
jgi:endonuclease/exonuclease/phosphatase family metal-dependent hydrolase